MHLSIQRALAAQYNAFREPAPRSVHGCACCSTTAELEALVSRPRHDLTATQLDFYASSAILTVGDVSDLRHYWPRLSELSISGELFTDPEVVFAKPRHGLWRTWPSREQDALVGLAHAQLEALSEEGETLVADSVETWVCSFGQYLDDVTVILAPLLRPEPGPAAALRAWYIVNERSLPKGALSSAFWEAAPANAAKVRAWFAEPAVTAAIDRAFTPPLAAG